MGSYAVVYDVNVLLNAAPAKGASPLVWPRLPAPSGNPDAEAVGVANDRRDFALWLSPHILKNTRRVMTVNWKYDEAEVEAYLDVLVEIANRSGGGVVDPPRTVHVNRDHEDNLIIDLAAEVDARLIVSNDTDLTSMPLWRGTPVVRPTAFRDLVANEWRKRGRSTEPSTTDLMKRRLEKEAAAKANAHAADSAVAPTAPDSYRTLRAEFDANHARATEIVDGWNPHNAALQPRIELWKKVLPGFANQAAQADLLAATEPDAAESVLVTINTKLDFALERMDPRRAARTGARSAAAKQLRRPVFDDEPAATDERQFGS